MFIIRPLYADATAAWLMIFTCVLVTARNLPGSSGVAGTEQIASNRTDWKRETWQRETIMGGQHKTG